MGKVVVLADNLEEALSEAEVDMGRDYSIRLAIVQAAKQKLPLIITSRPHDPLRHMPASIIQLEPLGEEAMLEDLQRNTYAEGRHLDWIVQTADPAEEPIYLQITRELDREDLLDSLVNRDCGRLDTRRVDRAEVRLRLLDTWVAAHISGYPAPGAPLSERERALRGHGRAAAETATWPRRNQDRPGPGSPAELPGTDIASLGRRDARSIKSARQ